MCSIALRGAVTSFLIRVLRTRGRGSADEYAFFCAGVRLPGGAGHGQARRRDLQDLVMCSIALRGAVTSFLIRVLRTRGRGSADEYAFFCAGVRLPGGAGHGQARRRDLQDLVTAPLL